MITCSIFSCNKIKIEKIFILNNRRLCLYCFIPIFLLKFLKILMIWIYWIYYKWIRGKVKEIEVIKVLHIIQGYGGGVSSIVKNLIIHSNVNSNSFINILLFWLKQCLLILIDQPCFVFAGGKNSQYQQVGNAVPPLLAEAVARYLLDAIESQDTASN